VSLWSYGTRTHNTIDSTFFSAMTARQPLDSDRWLLTAAAQRRMMREHAESTQQAYYDRYVLELKANQNKLAGEERYLLDRISRNQTLFAMNERNQTAVRNIFSDLKLLEGVKRRKTELDSQVNSTIPTPATPQVTVAVLPSPQSKSEDEEGAGDDVTDRDQPNDETVVNAVVENQADESPSTPVTQTTQTTPSVSSDISNAVKSAIDDIRIFNYKGAEKSIRVVLKEIGTLEYDDALTEVSELIDELKKTSKASTKTATMFIEVHEVLSKSFVLKVDKIAEEKCQTEETVKDIVETTHIREQSTSARDEVESYTKKDQKLNIRKTKILINYAKTDSDYLTKKIEECRLRKRNART